MSGCAFHRSHQKHPKQPEQRQVAAGHGMFWRMAHPFHRHHDRADSDSVNAVSVARGKDVEVRMGVTPAHISLGDTRRLDVTLQLVNVSKRFKAIHFATSQRFEIVILNDAGKRLTQWSEDHAFEKKAANVALNPGEMAEYSATISTREMSAGNRYTVEAWLLNQPDLKVRKVIVAQP